MKVLITVYRNNILLKLIHKTLIPTNLSAICIKTKTKLENIILTLTKTIKCNKIKTKIKVGNCRKTETRKYIKLCERYS